MNWKRFYKSRLRPVWRAIGKAVFFFFQIALLALAAAIVYYHAFPIDLHARHTDYPVLDAVTLGALGIMIVAVLLPRISEITMGGASVKLKEAEESAEDYSEVAEDLANLAQNWSTSMGILSQQLQDLTNQSEKDRLLSQYFRDRMGEAQAYLTDDPDDEARIALWMYDQPSNSLKFVYALDFTPTKTVWNMGEGMIGKAFEEGRPFNEPDVRTVPCYQATRKGAPPYRAVLVYPVFLGSRKLGALTVDKREAELFDPIAVEVAKGLSAQCAMADFLWQNL